MSSEKNVEESPMDHSGLGSTDFEENDDQMSVENSSD
jgi:hypothetical protein